MSGSLQHEPDKVEVIRTATDAAAMALPPLLVLDTVTAFLDERGLGEGPIGWQRIGDGQSNVTSLLARGETRMVLRRGPRPPLPRSTHDMVREARIQQLLRPHGVPVPEILAVSEDPAVLGVPFYVMEALDGEVITDSVPPVLDGQVERRQTAEAFLDTLVRLHAIDVTQGEIAWDGPAATSTGRSGGSRRCGTSTRGVCSRRSAPSPTG